MRKTALCCALLVALVLCAHDGTAYNNRSMPWQTLTTEHFQVHYHEGAEWTAQMVAQVAEEVHGPLTDLYGYEPPNPVHFVIKDTDDYANGAAFFYDNKVEIWATNLEFGFRGTSDWIRNVITHEYAHIISIQASTKMPNRIPAIYFQMIGFETEKRSDVLNGYPNLIVSYPYSGVNMPPWFAEGIAQYQSPNKQYDCWDSHRDMILRSAVLEDKMLTYDEMGFFGKSSLKSEQVYDHGYGLVRYIAGEFGAQALKDITHSLGSFTRLNMDGALKKVTGKSGDQLYNEWKDYLHERYTEQIRDVRSNLVVGARIAPEGLEDRLRSDEPSERDEGNLFALHHCRRCGMQFRASEGPPGFMTTAPVFSHDGKRIAFLSNMGSDFSGTALYIADADGGNAKALKGGVASRPRFSPDDSHVLYSRKHRVDSYGATVNDLFTYDLEQKKEKQLTKSARVADPDYSPDGRSIVCVDNRDGTHRLIVVDADGSKRRVLFESKPGAQLYNPQFSPDGTRILFGIFKQATRDIATIAVDGTGFRYELRTASDERDARWSGSGQGILFASDRSGVFNIYEMDLEDGWVSQRTNVPGGAFMPDMSPDGTSLVYAGYTGDGYRVFKIDDVRQPVATFDVAAYEQRTAGPFDECGDLRAAALEREESGGDEFALAAVAAGEAQNPVDAAPGGGSLQPTKYKSQYTPFHFYPRLVIYDEVPRLGLFMNSYEVLDKQNFFLGGSYGTDGEYDAFLRYEIRNLYPTLYADFFLVREKTDDSAVDTDPTSVSFAHRFDFDLRYDLWQADVGLRFEFGPTLSLTRQHDVNLYWSHGEYRVNIEGKEFDEDGFLGSFDGGWKYYVGDQAHLQYTFRKLTRAVDTDINPRGGRQVSFHYMRSFDDLFTTGEFLYAFRPAFTANHYSQYTLDWKEYIALPWSRHSLRLRAFGSVIDNQVDDFFWTYLGGQDGIRGYTYYSIGGRKGVIGSALYRFPIVRNINKQFLHLYFRDLYGGVFYEAANAWESGYKTTSFRTSLGYELRLSLGSYYIFPTAISLVSAYAFDPVSFTDSFGDLPVVITKDEGFSYYLSVGFGFDL